jgi:uncharacterized protein (TIGR03435 family)
MTRQPRASQANHCRRLTSLAALCLALASITAAPTAHAQSPEKQTAATTKATTPADPTLGITFDVVSIKPNPGNPTRYGVTSLPEGDGLSAEFFTIDDMVRWAYHLGHRWGEPDRQDVPKWYATDRYDIRAKVAPSDVTAWHTLNEEARRLVFRRVLAERFHLVCHFEDREVPVYNLVIAKGGLKMTEAKPGEISPWHFHAPGDPNTAYSGPGMTMRDTPNGPLTVFQRLDMLTFSKSDAFAMTVDRPVVDRTGLTGVYNFSLDFSYQPMNAPSSTEGEASVPASPDIFTAIQKQLGLKLEPAQGHISQLIVDHVERPTDD